MLKTLSFAAVHFTVAFTIGYLLTGSMLVGGTMALIEPACNTVAYHFHEKAWARIAARRRQAPSHQTSSRQAPAWLSAMAHSH